MSLGPQTAQLIYPGGYQCTQHLRSAGIRARLAVSSDPSARRPPRAAGAMRPRARAPAKPRPRPTKLVTSATERLDFYDLRDDNMANGPSSALRPVRYRELMYGRAWCDFNNPV